MLIQLREHQKNSWEKIPRCILDPEIHGIWGSFSDIPHPQSKWEHSNLYLAKEHGKLEHEPFEDVFPMEDRSSCMAKSEILPEFKKQLVGFQEGGTKKDV